MTQALILNEINKIISDKEQKIEANKKAISNYQNMIEQINSRQSLIKRERTIDIDDYIPINDFINELNQYKDFPDAKINCRYNSFYEECEFVISYKEQETDEERVNRLRSKITQNQIQNIQTKILELEKENNEINEYVQGLKNELKNLK